MSRIDRLICHVMPKAFLMALTAEGRLVELQVVRRDRPSRVDSVFLGRLERVMPELAEAGKAVEAHLLDLEMLVATGVSRNWGITPPLPTAARR